MARKYWMLMAATLAAVLVYGIVFGGWFQPKHIRVFHMTRNLRPRLAQTSAQPGLMFGINRESKLTEIRVVQLDAWQTNHNTLPVWHLVSASNSVPVKMFEYGQIIRGMKPSVAGSRAQPITTNVIYRLFIAAGSVTGEHDFQIGEKPAAEISAGH